MCGTTQVAVVLYHGGGGGNRLVAMEEKGIRLLLCIGIADY